MMRVLMLAAMAGLCPGASALAADRAGNAVVVDPDSHVVVFENEHVRVIENFSGMGKSSSPMHSHNSMLVISLEKTRLKMTVPGEAPFILDLRPGQVLWLDDAEHSWEILAGQLHAIAVEVKSAAKAN
jgi:hypothetical protein